jgi:signal transduction histidine kinase
MPGHEALYRLSLTAALSCGSTLLVALLHIHMNHEGEGFAAVVAWGLAACVLAMLMMRRLLARVRDHAEDRVSVTRLAQRVAEAEPGQARAELCRAAAQLCDADLVLLLEPARDGSIEVTGIHAARREDAERASVGVGGADLWPALHARDRIALPQSGQALSCAGLGMGTATLLPLRRHGAAIGAFVTGWAAEAHSLTARQSVAVSLLASEAAPAVERADLIADVRGHAADLGAVVDITRRLRGSATASEGRRLVCEAALEVCGGDFSMLMEHDGAGTLVATASAGMEIPAIRVPTTGDGSMTGRVFRTLEPRFAGDLMHHPQVDQSAVVATSARSALWQPVVGNGGPLGVLVVGWARRMSHLPDRTGVVAGLFAAEAAVALERADMLARMERLNRTLHVQVEALRLSDQVKTDFVSSVSHELRTPLASILGYLDILLEGEAGPIQPDQREFVEIVDSNARRLLSLINDLLTLSGIESGNMVLRTETLDLREIVETHVRDQYPAAKAKGLDLALGLPPASTPAEVDVERFGQVISNVVANAIKFTPEGGRVSVALGRTRDGVAVSVSDTGIGIHPDDREKLFERFFRARNAADNAIPGTGLGLAICKAIVDAHGGSVTVEGELDKGTTVTVAIPATQDETGGSDD